MSIKKPKTINLGAFVYKIIYHRKSGKDMGVTFLDKKRIHIYKHESKQALRDTILHETVHILLEDLIENLEKMECPTEDKEEFLVRMITPKLLQLILNNPEFILWLQSNNPNS